MKKTLLRMRVPCSSPSYLVPTRPPLRWALAISNTIHYTSHSGLYKIQLGAHIGTLLFQLGFLPSRRVCCSICVIERSHAIYCLLGDRKYDNDPAFRKFKRQLYHSSISAILSTLKPAMSTPAVYRCPDGHFRRVIFGIGPFIADYPEQVILAGGKQGWCPRCVFLLSFRS
jgi:hypothetical protein